MFLRRCCVCDSPRENPSCHMSHITNQSPTFTLCESFGAVFSGVIARCALPLVPLSNHDCSRRSNQPLFDACIKPHGRSRRDGSGVLRACICCVSSTCLTFPLFSVCYPGAMQLFRCLGVGFRLSVMELCAARTVCFDKLRMLSTMNTGPVTKSAVLRHHHHAKENFHRQTNEFLGS